MGLCTWMCSVVCAVCFEVDFCARALCVRAHAVVRAQGRALCADSGLPGLRAGGALTWADVLVLVCVLRFFSSEPSTASIETLLNSKNMKKLTEKGLLAIN